MTEGKSSCKVFQTLMESASDTKLGDRTEIYQLLELRSGVMSHGSTGRYCRPCGCAGRKSFRAELKIPKRVTILAN